MSSNLRLSKSYLLLIILNTLIYSIFSQELIEINVCLSRNESSLETFFRQSQEKDALRNFANQAISQRIPALSDLTQTMALLPNSQISGKEEESIGRIFTLRFETQEKRATSLIDELLSSGAFDFVEENRTRTLHQSEPIPVNDDSISSQWYHDFIGTFDAWKQTRGNPDIKIGFIDTGLAYDHAEFEDQVFINSPEDINGNGLLDPWPISEVREGIRGDFDGIDNDRNGYVDDVAGYDFVDQVRSSFAGELLFEDGDPDDDNGHGTEVAGVIGAKPDNGIGGTGIAPGCKLVVLRAFGTTGSGEDDDIARSIIYAAVNGVQVLNMSFGDIIPSLTLKEAIRFAARRGVIMVSSAGNGTGDELHYPSGYDEVISVSASTANLVNRDEFLWPLSSFGLTVDLCAPGSDIFVPTLIDMASDGTIRQFRRIQGTSFAAPMVSAAIGLLLSTRESLTDRQARGILTSTADDLSDPGWDHFTGAGRLNIARALNFSGTSRVQITSPAHDQGSPNDLVPIIGTVLNPEFLRYHVEWQAGTEGRDEWNPIIMDQIYQVKDDTLAIWNTSTLADGEYTIRLRLEKTNGATSEDRIRFIKDLSPANITFSVLTPIWDFQERKIYMVFRSSDQAEQTLFFRQVGTEEYQQLVYGRPTRNGEFLLDQTQLSPGEYECFIQAKNFAGTISKSETKRFTFEPAFLPSQGFEQLPYTVPMGRMIDQSFDFDGDSLKEIVMSRFSENLTIRNVITLEFNGSFFQQVDSIPISDILIVKDVADSDQDGLLEILASVNDTTYLFEQPAINEYPSELIYTDQDNGLFPSQFADTDGDGSLELLTKNFQDYFIYEREGDTYVESFTLTDTTPNFSGSVAPRTLTEDFDMDGQPETLYGDRDGDFIIYEHTGGGNYEFTYIDTTNLTRASDNIAAGDFDGDGQQEFFVAVHPSDDRNDDFEYNAAYWWLRIFKATGDNQYEVVFEDYIYDVETERLNAATAGNIDNDPEEELVFTTFPKTYIYEYENGEYSVSWYHLGSVATHHIIEDFNENGIQEIGLGLGDSTYFFEKQVDVNGPSSVNSLSGAVLGPNSVQLSWLDVPNATAYQLIRVEDPFNNSDGLVSNTFNGLSILDTALIQDQLYLYSVTAVNPNLTPTESAFGNAIILRPHARPRIDSLVVLDERQLALYFTEAVVDRAEDKFKFVLNDSLTASSVTNLGVNGQQLILSFDTEFHIGINELKIDTTFFDRDLALLHPADSLQIFSYEKVPEESLIITRWEVLNDKQVKLTFNFPLDELSALDSLNYAVSPLGSVEKVSWGSEDQDMVIIDLRDARIGSLGYAVSISVSDVCSITGVCIANEGNTATFSSHRQNLSDVFVYPNPVQAHGEFDGLRFANLTQRATIRIFSVSGRLIQTVEEVDGDGGANWNLKDLEQQKIKPGVYLYHVTSNVEGVEEFLGKFSVVE